MSDGQIIALDLGMSKTGIARASAAARLVEPLHSVPTGQLLTQLADLDQQQPLQAIVVGLPRNLNGEDTSQTTWVRQWVARAKTDVKWPLYWQDEALTSRLAGAHKSKHPLDEDALAAATILQDFLDSDEADRVRC